MLVSSLSCVWQLQPRGWWPARLLCPGDSPGKGTGVGCHFLPQEICVTWGSNLGLLNYQADSLLTEPPGSSDISLKDHIFLFWNNYHCLLHTVVFIIWWIIKFNFKDFPGTVKCPPALQETGVLSLGREDPLEKEMATHSRILAWRIPWTEEPGGLQSMWSQRVGHD